MGWIVKIFAILQDLLKKLSFDKPNEAPNSPRDEGSTRDRETHAEVGDVQTSPKWPINEDSNKEEQDSEMPAETEELNTPIIEETKPQNIVFELRPFLRTEDSTLSKLYHREKFVCYILEDGVRSKKIQDRTAVWAGVYEIKKRTWGGFYETYKAKFNHSFAIWITGVFDFKSILIHIGNTIINTRGCLLTGTGWTMGNTGNYEVTKSTQAYQRVHEFVKEELKGGRIYIRILR